MQPDRDQLLTIGRLAEHVPLGAGKLRTLVKANEIRHHKIGGRYYVTLAQWDEFLARQERGPSCQGETKDHVSNGSTSAGATTSVGPKAVGAASTQRAQASASKLKSISRDGSPNGSAPAGQVTPLRSS